MVGVITTVHLRVDRGWSTTPDSPLLTSIDRIRLCCMPYLVSTRDSRTAWRVACSPARGLPWLAESTDRAGVTDGDEELLLAVASQLCVAAENAVMHRQESDRLRSYVHMVTRAQEDERTQIASDLHDDVAQPLALVCWWLDDVAGRDWCD